MIVEMVDGPEAGKRWAYPTRMRRIPIERLEWHDELMVVTDHYQVVEDACGKLWGFYRQHGQPDLHVEVVGVTRYVPEFGPARSAVEACVAEMRRFVRDLPVVLVGLPAHEWIEADADSGLPASVKSRWVTVNADASLSTP